MSEAHPPGSSGSVEGLGRLLAGTGSALRRGVLVELMLGAVVSFLFALFLGTGLITLGVGDRLASGVALVLGLVGGVGFAVRAVLRWRRTASGPLAVARWLDEVGLRTGSKATVGLLDAAELRSELGREGESEVLRTCAIGKALDEAEASSLASSAVEASGRLARRLGVVAVALLALNLAAAIGDRDAYVRVASTLLSAEGFERVMTPMLPEPRLGDIRLDYRYPEYAARPPRTVVSATGRIRALPGTEVTIETRARRPLSSAVMVIEHGSGLPSENGDEAGADRRRIAVEVEGRRMRARFVVSRAGRYRLELVEEDGTRLAERRGHDIVLEEDAPPKVTLHQPEESPLEVNERDRIAIGFEADDDFGLGKARVAWRVLGTTRQGAIPLTEASAGRRSYRGRGRLALGKLQLSPGDRVAYSVEVFDNDTINGPKVGASETKELRVYSKRDHHQKVLALEMAALDAVVRVLGDVLEDPPPSVEDAESFLAFLAASDAIADGAARAVEALEVAAEAAESDPLARENLGDAFAQAAGELQRRAGAMRRTTRMARNSPRARRTETEMVGIVDRQIERMVDALERQAVYLSDLIDDQRMLDAENLAKDLREQQRALREALDAYREAPTEDQRRLISQAIEDIQTRIREIMSELAKLRAQIPQDFVNPDALQDRTEDMDAIRDRIEEGDLEAAMRALDRMLNQTERMLSQLQEGREELQTREYSEITERAERVWNELRGVQARQRDLAERTETIADEVEERSRERLGHADEFVEAQQERLRRAMAALEEVRPERHMPDADQFELVERRLEDGSRALEAKDFGAATEVLEQSTSQMRALDRDARRRTEQAERFGDVFGMGERAEATREALGMAKPEVEAVLEAIRELSPDPAELLDETERNQLQRFQDEQRALSEKAKEIRQELEKLGEQLPVVGPEVRAALDEAQSAMGQSGEALGSGDAPGAVGQERRAVEALERLSQQLEEMGSQSGGGQGGAGVPLPFGQPSGTDPQNERGGQGRFNRDKVEIPKPEAYQAPSEFREDILEAAKQGTVEAYRDAVRRYYEELVK